MNTNMDSKDKTLEQELLEAEADICLRLPTNKGNNVEIESTGTIYAKLKNVSYMNGMDYCPVSLGVAMRDLRDAMRCIPDDAIVTDIIFGNMSGDRDKANPVMKINYVMKFGMRDDV